MKLLTKAIRENLIANGKAQAPVRGTEDEIDFKPVVKLFTPDAGAIWLLTELDPEEPDIAFGLCDLGVGCPELGSVRISEIDQVRGRLGLPVERDGFFEAGKTLNAYAIEAMSLGRITRPDALRSATGPTPVAGFCARRLRMSILALGKKWLEIPARK